MYPLFRPPVALVGINLLYLFVQSASASPPSLFDYSGPAIALAVVAAAATILKCVTVALVILSVYYEATRVRGLIPRRLTAGWGGR